MKISPCEKSALSFRAGLHGSNRYGRRVGHRRPRPKELDREFRLVGELSGLIPAGLTRSCPSDKLKSFSAIRAKSMSDSIHVNLPDGSDREVPKGTTPLDIAKSISPRLADAALVAKTNGDLIDLTRPLEKDTKLRLLTEKDPEALQVYRHSSAHLLAAAVLELFPETKLGHGPPTAG